MSNAAFWLAMLVMVIGTIGAFLPMLPGTPLIFISALAYGYYEGFNTITPLILGILFGLMVLTLVIDYFAGVLGVQRYGASKYGVWGSFIGGILGVVFFSIPGLLLGPFAGAVTGELLNGRQAEDAIKVGFGSFIGIAGGSLFKGIFAVAMIIVFITFAI
ncbi:DUF456 domain-containing protein [Phosphitispora sp. TUW77]|uniref:DUF456 domain-containing protein n=1 Tax=Phosphitispora sp. TUW77 TaxID=3152361 RepID=UPI003AB3079B